MFLFWLGFLFFLAGGGMLISSFAPKQPPIEQEGIILATRDKPRGHRRSIRIGFEILVLHRGELETYKVNFAPPLNKLQKMRKHVDELKGQKVVIGTARDGDLRSLRLPSGEIIIEESYTKKVDRLTGLWTFLSGLAFMVFASWSHDKLSKRQRMEER